MVAKPVHVWEFITEELEERGWTLDDLASRMGGEFGVDRLTLDFVEHSQHELALVMGEHTSAALGRAFGVHEDFFDNLHKAWRDHAKAQCSTGSGGE